MKNGIPGAKNANTPSAIKRRIRTLKNALREQARVQKLLQQEERLLQQLFKGEV